jgi:MFS family permease
MDTPAKLNISEIIDHSSLGPFQVGICVLCGLCLIMDGFDVQAMGYVAPAIIREWKIPNSELGPVFGAGLLGVLIGSLVFSMLADKIGRRPVLIGATLFFSAMTFVTAHASSVPQMLAIRFIAGMGLGGIMPNAVALCGEYSSRATRVTVMTIVGNGFTAGAAIGGFISAWLIPNFGWRSVFYFGATIPLVIAIAMFFWLPESLQFLVLRGRDLNNVNKWLRRVDSAAVPNGSVQYEVAEKKREGVPVLYLFRDGRALGTVLLWIVNFMNLLNLYFLSSWLPTVVRFRIFHFHRRAGWNHGAGRRNHRGAWSWVVHRAVRFCSSAGDLLCVGVCEHRDDRASRSAAGTPIYCGLPGGNGNRRRASGNQRAGSDLLSDNAALHWNRLGSGDRENRRHSRSGASWPVHGAALVQRTAVHRSGRPGSDLSAGDVGDEAEGGYLI